MYDIPYFVNDPKNCVVYIAQENIIRKIFIIYFLK